MWGLSSSGGTLVPLAASDPPVAVSSLRVVGHHSGIDTQRIDKWLWAARLLKTRSLAIDAVRGGHVQVNGQRVKPSKEVRAGDRIELRIGARRMEVDVLGCAQRRGPASEAALLYAETPESREARDQAAAEARLAAPQRWSQGGRPTKRDRRRMEETRRGR
jgi:ribosome-associated heat shock protein Hsp15